jgi:hypothetical protein
MVLLFGPCIRTSFTFSRTNFLALSHRVQSAFHYAIKSVTPVNHFEPFIDKIDCFYHTSNTNQMELNSIAQDYEVEIRKIG